MASLIKRPTSRFWTAAFRDAKGRQYHRSTGETDRKRAQAIADKYELAAKGKGNIARVRRTLNEFLRDHFAEDVPFLTTQSFIDQWLAAREAEVSVGTFRTYREATERFLSFLGTDAKAPLEDITKAQVVAFRDALAARHSAATVNMRLAVIKMALRTARIDGCLLQDPAENVKTLKNQNAAERRPFTVDELKRILEVADAEWQSLIKFGIYTGQRIGDLASIAWAQIDLERDEIIMTTRKTGRRLLIPIAAPLREHLLSLESGDNPRSPVHPKAHENITTGHGARLSNQFTAILVAAGLREPPKHELSGLGRSGRSVMSDVSFHSLRHTAVSLLKDAGVPDAVVMALVGHENAKMSARYTHVGKEALAKAAKTLPEIVISTPRQ